MFRDKIFHLRAKILFNCIFLLMYFGILFTSFVFISRHIPHLHQLNTCLFMGVLVQRWSLLYAIQYVLSLWYDKCRYDFLKRKDINTFISNNPVTDILSLKSCFKKGLICIASALDRLQQRKSILTSCFWDSNHL